MSQLTKFKEAIKTALALVIVYAIALNASWMNPAWAGWAVAMISLATAGQSIQKGILRLAGTIPGCLAALAILSIAPQDRWLFVLLTSGWVFVMTYMMLVDKRHAYFWNVAGFVCLIILTAGSNSSDSLFQHAVFRTIETAMGVVVYTLISVFLWPRTNAGAIRKASSSLAATQASLIETGGRAMLGEDTGDSLTELHTQEIQRLSELAQALGAEAAESYAVHELRPLWDSFHALSGALMDTLGRWRTDGTELGHIDLTAAAPDLPAFFSEIGLRFEAIQDQLDQTATYFEPSEVPITIDHAAAGEISKLDRAALALVKKELEAVDALSRKLHTCARNLGESARGRIRRIRAPETSRGSTPGMLVPDIDHLRGATFAATVVVVGFLIWIFIDPPGHAGWFQFPAVLSMAVAGMQQARTTMLVKPVAIALALGLGVYVFIMPRLSTFLELGSVMFLCMFITCFFFSGIARLAGAIGILNMIAVQNQQTYNFAAMANSCLFTIMAFLLVYAMSFLLGSPRPEKVVLSMVRRFFRSAQHLVAAPRHRSLFGRWEMAFHHRQLKLLPAKIAGWGKAIDRRKFPANQPQQVQALVTSLQAIANRTDQLLDSDRNSREADFVSDRLRDDLNHWQGAIGETLEQWAKSPAAEQDEERRELIGSWADRVEQHLAEIGKRPKGEIDPGEGEQFLRLIGGYRGIAQATLAYAGSARGINWSQWKEEQF